jgi:hypothetical protein
VREGTYIKWDLVRKMINIFLKTFVTDYVDVNPSTDTHACFGKDARIRNARDNFSRILQRPNYFSPIGEGGIEARSQSIIAYIY